MTLLMNERLRAVARDARLDLKELQEQHPGADPVRDPVMSALWQLARAADRVLMAKGETP